MYKEVILCAQINSEYMKNNLHKIAGKRENQYIQNMFLNAVCKYIFTYVNTRPCDLEYTIAFLKLQELFYYQKSV